ncbi:MAG TPA: hypothetical protein VGH86_12190 [Phenylobacterium sp.]
MAKSKTARSNPALRLGLIRQLHIYLSVFVAPTLIFFAITGALQTFRIPDQKGASVTLVKLARLHKDTVFAVKPPRPKRPEGANAGGGANGGERHGPDAGPPAKPQPKPSTEALKWFFSLASVGIAVTTLFGLWMALAYSKRKAILWVILVAGTAAPVLLLAL